MRRLSRILLAALLVTSLGGCGLLAAPCRVASAVIKIIPVVGHAAAGPTALDP
jgi:hypothetical protein